MLPWKVKFYYPLEEHDIKDQISFLQSQSKSGMIIASEFPPRDLADSLILRSYVICGNPEILFNWRAWIARLPEYDQKVVYISSVIALYRIQRRKIRRLCRYKLKKKKLIYLMRSWRSVCAVAARRVTIRVKTFFTLFTILLFLRSDNVSFHPGPELCSKHFVRFYPPII